VNLHPFFAGPLGERLVSIAELKTLLPSGAPLIELDDVADLVEILQVRAENEHRAHKAAEAKARKR